MVFALWNPRPLESTGLRGAGKKSDFPKQSFTAFRNIGGLSAVLVARHYPDRRALRCPLSRPPSTISMRSSNQRSPRCRRSRTRPLFRLLAHGRAKSRKPCLRPHGTRAAPDRRFLVLDWIARTLLKREWFFEQRDGNCRLMGEFAAQLSETAPKWRAAVAPLAEWVARILWSTTGKSAKRVPGTPLTQQRRREANGTSELASVNSINMRSVCSVCGAAIPDGRKYCGACATSIRSKQIIEVARIGRICRSRPRTREPAVPKHSGELILKRQIGMPHNNQRG